MHGYEMLPPYFAGEPMRVGTTEQLLLDDSVVEDHWNLRRRQERVLKHPANPIITGDQPWEDSVYIPMVHYDQGSGRFQMWYSMSDEEAYRSQSLKDFDPLVHGRPYFTSYAESEDGIHWTKPRLPGRTYRHWKATNVVLGGRICAEGTCVLPLPQSAPPRRRFIAVYADYGIQRRGEHQARVNIHFAYSDDGITWEADPANPVVIGDRDQYHSLVYDEQRKLFLMYLRPATWAGVDDSDPVARRRNAKRRFSVIASADLKNWSYPRTVLVPDEADVPDIDQFQVFRYGSHFIGFATRMNVAAGGTQEPHLVFSRDGLHWQKLIDSRPFIPPGRPGDWDAGQLIGPSHAVRCGNWLYMYYSGTPSGIRCYNNLSSIGLAKLKPGRFVGREAGETSGYLLTRELLVEGNRLFLNCLAYRETPPEETALGEIRVEILERVREPSVHLQARPIPGFSFDDCDPICLHLERAPVTWKGSAEIGQFRGKPVYLRFRLRRAILYSFVFAAG